MTAWPFIIFAILFLILTSAHLFLAYQKWTISREEQSSVIDSNYVRMEDYFARSFRSKVADWLKLPAEEVRPDGTRTIRKGRELIRVTGSVEHPPKSRSDDIQVVEGAFVCGAGCVFSREIYAHKDASIGSGSHLQAIAVDGDLILADHVSIVRWADSAGDMVVGADSVVRARATAGKTIRLRKGAQVGSAFAPLVTTSLKELDDVTGAAEPAMPLLEISVPGNPKAFGRWPESLGLDPEKLSPLGTDSLLYTGDLKPRAPFRSKTKLIVKGDCSLPADSVLEADLKADGRIEVGQLCICKGNVVGSGDIWFGPSSRFYGVIHAGKTLVLSGGCSGGEYGAFVAAYAVGKLLVEENVTIYGKLASGDRVVVVPEAPKKES